MGAVRRVGVTLTMALLALAACSTGAGGTPTADNSLPWPSTLPTGPTPPPPSFSASAPPPAFARPADAASRLLDAWLARDQAKAAVVASPSAIVTLFAVDPKTRTWFFGGCSSDTECDFNAAHQVARLLMGQAIDGGYEVISVQFGGAG